MPALASPFLTYQLCHSAVISIKCLGFFLSGGGNDLFCIPGFLSGLNDLVYAINASKCTWYVVRALLLPKEVGPIVLILDPENLKRKELVRAGRAFGD